MAIMISVLVVPLDLGLLSFFPPSSALASSAMTTRFSAAVLLLLIGLGVTSAGKQDHLCTLLAIGAVIMGAIMNHLSLTRRSNPSSVTCVMTAVFASLGCALALGGRVLGYKLYVDPPTAPGITSSVLFAAWFTISQGGRAVVTLAGTHIPSSHTLSARDALLVQSHPPLAAALATVFITLLFGNFVDHSGSVRGHAWLQLVLLVGAVGFVLYMIPRTDDKVHGEDNESYDLLPADKPRTQTSSSYAAPVPSSLIPIISTICIVPMLVLVAQQSGLLPYRPSFDRLAVSAKSPPLLPGTVTRRHRLPPTAYDASPLLSPTHDIKSLARPQLEVVFAYYAEPLEGLPVIINDITREVNWWNTKVTAYHKGLGDLHSPRNTSARAVQAEILTDFVAKTGVDEVVPLENIGREGATYLRHILHHWDDLAYQTIFLQGHVVFEDEFWERLKLINERVGFMSFGHYLTVTHGSDGWGNGDFPRTGDIYELFRDKPYPHEPLLATYHGQFIVSRERIKRHPKHKYEKLLKILEAPMDDPIHNEGWGYKDTPESPANPFFGHSLERAWTLIFECDDPLIEKDCWVMDPVSDRCYCEDF
ncbi:hypothetical protein FIBSPDRAFT_534070 [Athelia psychrophila]|uniref:Uncharacterized protein n=1 Tax=Athelia psychrophila TaxID=1759441 RepID=A0A166JC87_9AGAM|nr:hypothetical protein FIBSPDRAFT_534070 [Fibularhizoctonia sp. CBS 109695]